MKKAWALKQIGFTIVELLIVIVVVAILATISVAAYNGIQTRAENTKTISAVKEYVKGLKMYAANEGRYPIAGWSCLGKHPGTTCSAAAGQPSTCNGNGVVSSSSTFDAEMKKVFSGVMPQPSAQSVNCGGTNYSGAYYYSTDGVSTALRYILRGDQPCEGIGGINYGSRYQIDDATLCYTSLPTP